MEIQAVPNVSSGSKQGPIAAALQAQLAYYTHLASTLNAKAKDDYRILQTSISSGDLSTAEAALIRLQSDCQCSITAQTPSPTLPTAPPQTPQGGQLNTTA